MKKELKGFCTGVLLTSAVLFCIPAFADSIVKSIKVTVNSITLKVNGNKVTADNFLYDGRTYVQLRNVCDLLGKDLSWEKETNTAEIRDKKSENTQQTQQTQQNNGTDTTKPQSNDSVKPTVTEVKAITANSIEVLFSEKVNKALAENSSNYAISERYGKKTALPVLKAVLDSEGTKVTLSVGGQNASTLYNIDISNISDAAGNIMDKAANIFVGMGNGTSNSTPTDNTEKFAATYVMAKSLTTLEIGFNHKVTEATAECLANYKLNEKYGTKKEVAVLSAELSSDQKTVIITTAGMNNAILYDINFKNINDIYGYSIDTAASLAFVSKVQ